jgi:chromosomal replication initiator protein
MPLPLTEPDNAAYTIETFVAGDSSRSIAQLCVEVSNKPGEAHNPLLLHGRTGSGKTHLLHAIAHELRSAHAGANVLRLSTDVLVDSLIRAIRADTVAMFHQELLAVDALLLDDIHSLSGKPRTLSEVCHHLNALVSARRQVVVTSITPDELQFLAGRLPDDAEPVLVEIRYPDLSGRMVIARRAAAAIGATLSDRALRAVAESVIRSAPEIRGVIARIAAEEAARGKVLSARGVITLLRQLGRTNGD